MSKKVVSVVIIMASIFLFAGCFTTAEQTPQEAVSAEPEVTPMIETTQIPSPIPAETPGIPQDFSYDDSVQIIVEYQNETTQEKEESVYEITDAAGNSTALAAVNEVVFGEDKIEANSIVFSDGNLFIDFNSSIYNTNLGSTGEGNILEAIAATYLNNVQEIKAVYYSVNGEDYSSGHIIQDKDQPFKTKQ